MHLFEQPVIASAVPSAVECSSLRDIALHGRRTPVAVAQDVWCGFGPSVPAQSIHMYTDGSYAADQAAWAVAVDDAWLSDNFGRIPLDEQLLRPADTAGAALYGCAISCTRGIYSAELQAMARALAMLPLSCHLTVHSDSQAAIAAVAAFAVEQNERKRLRRPGRPLLLLVSELLRRRHAAGGSCTFQHVRAHTQAGDIHSVGNRLADYHANYCREAGAARSRPARLAQLPVSDCEPFLALLDRSAQPIIDDVRRSALTEIRAVALRYWGSKIESGEPQAAGLFAGRGMLALSRAVLQHGSAQQQATLVHVATNSIHCHWVDGADGLQRLQCEPCGDVLDVSHLAQCEQVRGPSVAYRVALLNSVLRVLRQHTESRLWLAQNAHLATSLSVLLTALYPDPEPRPGPAPGRDPLDPVYAVVHHPTLCMLGAVTRVQVSAATHVLGLQRAANGEHELFRELRLLCLTSVAMFYADQKSKVKV